MTKKAAHNIPNCWDFENCPSEVREKCPAYPDKGKECWKVTGTKCAHGKYEKASLSEKIIYCRNECAFYKKYLKNVHIRTASLLSKKKS
jgi:hypothetical protein